MNQKCKVCGEPAAGFHFGAFTCEGCKSFFGRSYNNLPSIADCKNKGQCVINKRTRTSCKACRLAKCIRVGMSKSSSRYGRRSNWFKIHCLVQEQHQAAMAALRSSPPTSPFSFPFPPPSASSPDSESSEGNSHFPISFPPVFMGPSPFLFPPQMFPFPPTPPLRLNEEDEKPIFNNNNNYVSKNKNLDKDPKRFYLDNILGLRPQVPSPPSKDHDDMHIVQENPIDLSVRSSVTPRSGPDTRSLPTPSPHTEEEEEEENIDVVHTTGDTSTKAIPLDLSV